MFGTRARRAEPVTGSTALAVAFAGGTCLLESNHAWAQGPGVSPPQPQTLFDEARTLMESGAFAEACPKLRESYQLDPATGTLLNLAFCLENQGAAVAAYRTYLTAQQRALDEGNADRTQFAVERLRILESRLVRIAFHEPAKEPGFWAQCDDQPAKLVERGNICVVEPGQHRLVYGAPGKMPHALRVDASEPGGEVVVELRRLVNVGPHRQASVAERQRPAPMPTPAVPAGLTDTTVAAISFGIAATAAVGTSYLGWRAKSEWDARNDFCSPGCDERASAAGERANRFAWAANIAGAAAVLSAGVGTYFLLRPRPKSVSTVFIGALTADQRGAMLTATFSP